MLAPELGKTLLPMAATAVPLSVSLEGENGELLAH